jgi:hypothetical protein
MVTSTEAEDTEAMVKPAKNGHRWSRTDDEFLSRGYVAGKSTDFLAKCLDRSIGSIRARLVKLCFELRGVELVSSPIELIQELLPWAAGDDELLINLTGRHVEIGVMSDLLERSELAIAYRSVDLGVAQLGNLGLVSYPGDAKKLSSRLKPQKWSQAEYASLKRAFYQGLSIEELARLTERSETSCITVLHACGQLSDSDLNAALVSALSSS